MYGIGANLDTARYRTLLAAACGVAVEMVDGHVIGEHGDAAVCCLSATTIQGHPLDSATTPPSELYTALHSRPGLITRGIGRVRAGAVGAILSALGKVLGETDGVEHLSVRYRHHGWLGLPVRFTRGAAPCPPLPAASRSPSRAARGLGARRARPPAPRCLAAPLVVVSLLTGIRTEEARALHWSHVVADGTA